MTNRTRTDAILLLGFCGFLFFFGLGSFGLVGADEPRYAQIAREMLGRHDWITPVLNGQPWLEKPALYYWEAMISYSLFGVSDWAARVPSALDATLMVVAIYLFLRRFRPGSEIDGALMTASCAATIGFARAASTDMPLTAMFTLALLCWYAWHQSGRRGYLAAFYAFAALGTLAKGPIAPFLAAVIIVAFAASQRNWRIVWRTLWLPGIAVFLAVALPWYVLVQLRNPEFARVFLWQHNLARFGSNLYHHSQPFWYYIPTMALSLMPWLLFGGLAKAEAARAAWASRGRDSNPEDSWNIFLLLWLVLPVVFFSLSQSKLPGYILPAVPAVPLLLADYLRRHSQNEDRIPFWQAALHGLLAAAPVFFALLVQYFLFHQRIAGRALLVASVIALILAAGVALTLSTRGGLRMFRFVTLIPVVIAVGAVLRIATPALDARLSARPIAVEILRVQTAPLPLAVFHTNREQEYGLEFYLNHPVERYERGQTPPGQHLLVSRENSQSEFQKYTVGRRVSHLGAIPAQHLEYFWVSAPGAAPAHDMPMP